jgi:beta-glucosidase
MQYASRPRTRAQEEERKKNKKWYERFYGGDRLDLRLKERDTRLIEALAPENPKTIVSIIAGSAVTMEEWKDRAPGILLMWYAGMEGGNALANVLFGEVNPSGKLPFTIPKTMEQLPYFDAFTEEIEYGYYHGYTLFDKENKEAAFPFGYGLSYTAFTYDSLKALTPAAGSEGEIKFSVQVANTGSRPGAEVTQLYIGFANSAVDRPVKLLRAFAKTELAAGESKTIELTVPVKDLAWYNPETGNWEVERMAYEVYVGGSSRAEDLLRGGFAVE